MLRSLPGHPVRIWFPAPLRFRPPSEISMTAPVPTFTGLENVASHLRRSFDDIGSVVVERVLNRNENTKVASMDLSPEALRAFLPHAGAEPTSGLPDSANVPPMGQDEQREAMLAWLRQTFAANMEGKPSEKFKVGLWRPGREALVGSVRVAVSGIPAAPTPAAADHAAAKHSRTWELLMPNGERIVTSDPEVVEAHRRMLESNVRGMVVFTEQVATFLQLVALGAEIERRQLALEAKARKACGLPPDHDWLTPQRSNVLPFQGSPKP